MKKLIANVLLSATILAGLSLSAVAQDTLKLPNMSYRTGPFAATGTPHMNSIRRNECSTMGDLKSSP